MRLSMGAYGNAGVTETASGPGSPSGQPAWGGGCDRIACYKSAIRNPQSTDPVATARGSDTMLMDAPGSAALIFNCTSGPGSPARQPRWGDGSDRMFAAVPG